MTLGRIVCLLVAAAATATAIHRGPDGFRLVSGGKMKPLSDDELHFLRRRSGEISQHEENQAMMKFKAEPGKKEPSVEATLTKLIDRLKNAQEEEDKAFGKVVEKCNDSDEKATDAVKKMREILPSAEDFEKFK